MMKKLTYFLTIASSTVLAQDVPPDQTVFFEQNPFVQPDLLIKKPSDETLPTLVLASDASLEEQISHAITNKNWKTLEGLLNIYKTTNNYDHILNNYAQGALYRFQGKQKKAIEMYKQIVANNPELHYPRFDLAMMLFEDKQFKEAQNQFIVVRPFLPNSMQALIDQLLMTIKKSQAWQPTANFSFEKTDNVNQSSNLKEISIGNATFTRDQDSLPQKAQGIGYTLIASRENNILDNHYTYLSAALSGTYYWDNTDFSEQIFRIDAGYKYKDIKQSFGVTPFVGQNLLGGSRYSNNYGTGIDYNRLLSKTWQVSSSAIHLQKRYQDSALAEYYNGYSNSQAIMIIYQPKPKVLLYNGLDWMQDRLEDKAESSDRKGLRSGILYFGDSIGLSANMRYAKREFSAENIWYGINRKDNEYEFGTSAWRKQWQWQGFTPKLNYKYQKIDSNLPLYERSNSSWFITMEKVF